MGLVDEFGHVVDGAPGVRVLEERPAEVTVCEVHVVTARDHHLDTKSTDQRKETKNVIITMVNENSLGLKGPNTQYSGHMGQKNSN